MKLYGSLSRLVAILFRKDSQDITVRPNQATTYTAARDIQLPPGDAAHVLTSADSTQTFTNKTISGASNTISNVSLTAGVTGTLPVANGGTNSNVTLNNNRVIQSSGGKIQEAAAITANRALASDANGIPVATATTDTELGYVSGVTSAIQTQFTGKASLTGAIFTGDVTLDNAHAVKFREATGGGTNFVSFAAPSALAGDTPYILPTAYPASSGYHLASDTSGTLSWAAASSVSSFKATWLAADGATKSITHSLGSTDVLVQVFDIANGQSIEMDVIQRTDSNTVDLTSSETPGVSWRVLILSI